MLTWSVAVATSVPQEQVQILPVQANHADPAYGCLDEQFFHSRVPDQGLPPTSILLSQPFDKPPTASHSLYGTFTPPLPNHQPTRSQVPASRLPLVSELPRRTGPFGNLPQFPPALLAQARQMNSASRMQEYQNPIDAHPQYQYVVQENDRITKVLASQQHLIMFRDAEIEALKAQLHEAEELSRQLSELPAVKRVIQKAQAEARERLNLDAAIAAAAASEHVEFQHVSQPATTPSSFVAKCEAVRDEEDVPSLLGGPVRFPNFASQSGLPGDAGHDQGHDQFGLDDSELFHGFAQFGDAAEAFGDADVDEFVNSVEAEFGDTAEEEFVNTAEEDSVNSAEEEIASQTAVKTDEE